MQNDNFNAFRQNYDYFTKKPVFIDKTCCYFLATLSYIYV